MDRVSNSLQMGRVKRVGGSKSATTGDKTRYSLGGSGLDVDSVGHGKSSFFLF